MSNRNWQRDVRALADKVGGTVEPRGKHLAVRIPRCQLVIVSSSASDHRAWNNVRRDVRRAMISAGYDPDDVAVLV